MSYLPRRDPSISVLARHSPSACDEVRHGQGESGRPTTEGAHERGTPDPTAARRGAAGQPANPRTVAAARDRAGIHPGWPVASLPAQRHQHLARPATANRRQGRRWPTTLSGDAMRSEPAGSKLPGPRPMDWNGVVMHRSMVLRWSLGGSDSAVPSSAVPPCRRAPPGCSSILRKTRPSAAPPRPWLVRAQDLRQLRRRRCGCPIPDDRERVASIEPVRRNRVVRAAPPCHPPSLSQLLTSHSIRLS